MPIIPVFLNDEAALISVRDALNKKQIFPRRYFYPSLNVLPYLPDNQPCPISEDVASRVLCLPFIQTYPWRMLNLYVRL